ncbi:MAG: hypothetical protein ACFFB2_04955 [Promethearchaeota archaeon]
MVNSYSDGLLVPFAKYLSKYGKWELSNLGASILIPNEKYHFNSILFRQHRLSFSVDITWQFIASVIIVDKEDFSNGLIPVFQRLKGLECEIWRKGLIRKNYQVVSHHFLKYLQKEIPNLVVSDYLVENLYQDESLRKMISTIMPDALKITLFSQPIATNKLDEYCIHFKEIFNNPSEIIWNINLEKYLGHIILKGKYQKVLDSIIEAFDIISIYIRKVTKRIEKEALY